MYASDLCCKLASPALGCGVIESWILSILFLASLGLCVLSLIKSTKKKDAIFFYVTLSLWNAFMVTTLVFPFDYTEWVFELITNTNYMLILVPYSVAILIMCGLLFDLASTGARKTQFFQIVFAVFLVAFMTIGVVLSAVNKDDQEEMRRSISLWRAATDLVIVIVMAVVVAKLSRSRKLVRGSALAFFVVVGARIALNVAGWTGNNPMLNYIIRQRAETQRVLATPARILLFFSKLLFDLVPAVTIVVVVSGVSKITEKLIGESARDRRSDSGFLND